jgi:uncharacterized protein YceK
MKKILAVFAVLVCVSGCATLQKLQDTYNGAVTKENLYAIENGAVVVFAGLKAYRQSCEAGALPASCRDVVARVQVYTRKVPPLLASLRYYVKQGDQTSAYAVAKNLEAIIDQVKAIAKANDVQVQ